MQARLRQGAMELAGIRGAWPSVETGTILVAHDSGLSAAIIGRRLAALAREKSRAEPPPQRREPWHARSVEEVAGALATSPQGLSSAEVRARLQNAGPNVIPGPLPRSRLNILAAQFANLPAALLATAGVLSVVTGGLAEAATIAGVLVLNASLGFAVESRAERTFESLAEPEGAPVSILRDRRAIDVPLADVVPGDVLLLARDRPVPADARVLRAENLSINEAMLTGESLPVAKSAATLDPEVPLPDRANMVWRGTAVTGGSGAAIAVATGRQSEIGRIHALLGDAAAPPTPMQRQLDQIGRKLIWISLAACGAVFGIGFLRGFAVLQLLRSSVSLGVAAIPEGLPTVATTTLARGVEEARRHGVLVRRIDAVETLGAVDVVCFDKTGTLTANRMRVAELVSAEGDVLATDPGLDVASGAALHRLLQLGVLCSETEIAADGRPSGSATENALVACAQQAGLDPLTERRRAPRLWSRYRSEAYRFMTTGHRLTDRDSSLVAVKGSPPEVLALCEHELSGGERVPLTPKRRDVITRANAAMAERALRVLGFAFREDPTPEPGPVSELTWVGLAGLADPVRDGAAELMRRLRAARVHPVVMTGDQPATARAVAEALGPDAGSVAVLDGADIDGLEQAALGALARKTDVFARVSPAQKLAIVRALQASGSRVAMVGDGFNDSPALKTADVGIAMGLRGAEAAREAADVVLVSDELGAVAAAIERGRATRANVRRAARYMLGTNLSEIVVVLAGTTVGAGEPLAAMQLLWINLISDVLPGLALAGETPSLGLMEAPPPTHDEPILPGAEWRRLAREGGVIAMGAMAAGAWGALRYGASPEVRTMTFGSLVLGQLTHALNCREARPGPNRTLAAALTVSFAAQVAAVMIPGLRGLLGIVPLAWPDLAVMLAGGLVPFASNRALRDAALTTRSLATAPWPG